jgi:hypothetical protein
MEVATKADAPTRRPLSAAREKRSWISTGATVFGVLVVVFIAVRLLNLVIFCFDSDEVFSVRLASQPWSGLFRDAGFDIVHPPLFYMLLKLWIAIGGVGVVWVRLLPALFSIASIVPLYYLGRSLRLSLWQINVALALLCINPEQVFHSQYVRMYSLLLLLSLCSYWAFVKYMNSETRTWRALAVLAAVNGLVVYSHYYGWAVVACQGLCLLIVDRKRLVGFLWSTLAVVACFIPWLLWAWHFASLRGGLKQNLGWIPRPKVIDLLGFYSGLTVPWDRRSEPWPLTWPAVSFTFLVVCAGLLVAGLWKQRRIRTALDRWRIPMLLIAAFLPPVASFAASQFTSESVWGIRHLMISAVPYYILIAIALGFLQLQRFRLATALFVAAWGVSVAIDSPVIDPKLRVNYEVLAKQMVAREPGGEHLRLVTLDRFLWFPLGYHLDQHAPGRWDAGRVNGLDELYAIKDDHFWLAYHAERWKGVPPRQLLTEHGYRVGPGIWVSDQWARIVAYPVWRPSVR